MKVTFEGTLLSAKKNEKGNMLKVKALQEDRVEYLTAFESDVINKLSKVEKNTKIKVGLNVYNKDYKGKTYQQAIIENVK